jgi:hypothetical protein
MQKWEYLVVYIQGSDVAKSQPEMDVYMDADKYSDQMNKYGQAGWELVSFEWTETGARAAFKRPAQAKENDVKMVD